MGWWRLLRQGCTQPKLSSADGTNRRRWPPFCHRSTSGSLRPSSVVCQQCNAQFAPQYRQTSRRMDWTRSSPGCHRHRKGIQGRGLLWSCREEPSRQRIAGAPTLSPGAHQNKGHGVPSTRSGWWQTASYPPGRTGTNARQYQPAPGRERAYAVAPYAWSMVSNAADRSSNTNTTTRCRSMACRMSLCTRIRADSTLW